MKGLNLRLFRGGEIVRRLRSGRRHPRLDTCCGFALLLANITVRDKINIVSTAIEFYSRTRNDDWIKVAQKTVTSIFKINAERNFLAHTQFGATRQGVEFLSIVAKGKLKIPDIVWTGENSDDKYAAVIDLIEAVDKIIEDMKHHKARVRLQKNFRSQQQTSHR
jgi:hypothetical protein